MLPGQNHTQRILPVPNLVDALIGFFVGILAVLVPVVVLNKERNDGVNVRFRHYPGSKLLHFFSSYVLVKQPMLCTAPQQPAVGKEWQLCFQIPFRVQLFYDKSISGKKGHKGDIVLAAHFMA